MPASIIIILALTLASAIAAIALLAMARDRRLKKELGEIRPLIGPALDDVSSYYNFSHYITESERAALADRYSDLSRRLRRLAGTRRLRESDVRVPAERLAKALTDTAGCKAENNRQFVKRELERNRAFFDTVLKYPLDAQQREAVVSLEDNVLVISSAGSGKTMTTVGKVRYLVDRQGVDPSRILLITFTRKAAESLSERLGEKALRCVTFHKLALDIIAEATGRRPTIADTAMPALVYHDLMDNDAAFRSAVTDYILGSRYRMPDQFEYGSREEYIEARQKYGVNAYYKDMDGRPVFCKSDEESRICDFLGRNGIRFRYEERYEKDTVDTDHRQYCPDFSIYGTGGDGKPRRVYLEHFAVNAAGRCPGWFTAEEERKYIEGIEWKRELHKRNGTVLLETRSADFHSGEVFRRLAGELRAAGIEPAKDGEDSGLSRELARQEQSILDMLTAFHFLLRSRGETTGQLLSRVKRKDLDTVNGIIVPYMSRYDAMCREKGVIDFTGAIVRATELCLEGHRHDYDYILVDEFQDISADRYRFLQSLRRESPLTKLFCVGDDWQSIYRFAGSDIALFKRFGDYFGYTKECRMETTYRFGEPCVGLSSRFILANKGQKEKTVRPFSGEARTDLRFVPTDGSHTAGQRVCEILASIPEDRDVYLLGRYGSDVNALNGSGFAIRRGNDGKVSVEAAGRRMTFMTVHQSKGLESDYVILLNCNGGTRGFPSEIADNPVLDYVLSEPDPFEFSEERRVFYVALTRAKNCTFVLYDRDRPSPFVAEFVPGTGVQKERKDEIPEEERCPLCRCGRRMMVKKGKAVNGNPYYVYACSNEAYGCDYRETRFVNLNSRYRR